MKAPYEPNLGYLLEEGEGHRDAIHIAVTPVTVGRDCLKPGKRVGVRNGVASPEYAPHIGILDPFYVHTLFEGERCWLLLDPYTITSLHHTWTHPAFEEEVMSASERWLRDFIAEARGDLPPYEILIAQVMEHVEEADEFHEGPEHLYISGYEASGDIPQEFWDHIQNVTGRSVGPEKRSTHFRCGC